MKSDPSRSGRRAPLLERNLPMTIWTTAEQIQDALLPTLFDQYENGNHHGIDFDINHTLTAEEKPIFDSWVGEARANGWIEQFCSGGIPIPRLYLLTAAGYLHFKPRMDFLRAVQG
jgi:hypothetical protein